MSAALLFSIQPMFTKMALPLFGGSPQVWNVSVVFYQVVLLCGYLYVHLIRRYVGVRTSVAIHVVLVVAAAALLPIALPRGWEPPAQESMASLWLLYLLIVSVGAPFFVLSATSPLVQAWFTSSGHEEAQNPYFLYGASNIGSLAALILYPIVIESTFGLHLQSTLWLVGYIGFALLIVATSVIAWRNRGEAAPATSEVRSSESVPWTDRLGWIALAFIPSSLMLGVTTHLSNVVAPIPLLWTFPLALYLLTFVIVFSRRGHQLAWAQRILPYALLPLVLLLALEWRLALIPYLAINLLAFFLLALLCHGKLAAQRPSYQNLTLFYVCLSIGGALGGAFNTFVAPSVFPNLGEYPLGIVLACLAVGSFTSTKRSDRALDIVWPIGIALVLFAGLHWLDGRIALAIALVIAFAAYGRALRFAGSIAAIFLVSALLIHPYGNAIATARNFFGIKWVLHDDIGNYNLLVHSGTLHGVESQDSERLKEPLAYFSRSGPLGYAMRELGDLPRGRSIAVIGLGAGATACYARPGEQWSFYEIDEQVVRIAEDPRYFSFLSLCTPGAPMIVGDARLKLAHAVAAQNAIMILDAYSADTIPTHLLTVEALDLYLRNLAPDGVLLFNISNNYFDLRPVLANLAAARGLSAYFRADTRISEAQALRTGRFSSKWVAMARADSFLRGIALDPHWRRLSPDSRVPLWTDDYSSLIRVLDFGGSKP